MSKLGITDTTLRDAHQSLMATRMRIEDMLPAVEMMDRVGYHSLEVWGSHLRQLPAVLKRGSLGAAARAAPPF